jgi:hypothetical protein
MKCPNSCLPGVRDALEQLREGNAARRSTAADGHLHFSFLCLIHVHMKHYSDAGKSRVEL